MRGGVGGNRSINRLISRSIHTPIHPHHYMPVSQPQPPDSQHPTITTVRALSFRLSALLDIGSSPSAAGGAPLSAILPFLTSLLPVSLWCVGIRSVIGVFWRGLIRQVLSSNRSCALHYCIVRRRRRGDGDDDPDPSNTHTRASTPPPRNADRKAAEVNRSTLCLAVRESQNTGRARVSVRVSGSIDHRSPPNQRTGNET